MCYEEVELRKSQQQSCTNTNAGFEPLTAKKDEEQSSTEDDKQVDKGQVNTTSAASLDSSGAPLSSSSTSMKQTKKKIVSKFVVRSVCKSSEQIKWASVGHLWTNSRAKVWWPCVVLNIEQISSFSSDVIKHLLAHFDFPPKGDQSLVYLVNL